MVVTVHLVLLKCYLIHHPPPSWQWYIFLCTKRWHIFFKVFLLLQYCWMSFSMSAFYSCHCLVLKNPAKIFSRTYNNVLGSWTAVSFPEVKYSWMNSTGSFVTKLFSFPFKFIIHYKGIGQMLEHWIIKLRNWNLVTVFRRMKLAKSASWLVNFIFHFIVVRFVKGVL